MQEQANPFEEYEELRKHITELNATQPAGDVEDLVEDLFAMARKEIETQAQQLSQELSSEAAKRAEAAIAAIDQLKKLDDLVNKNRLSEDLAGRIKIRGELLKNSIKNGARFLLDLEVDQTDPRVARILEAAGMAGKIALDSTGEEQTPAPGSKNNEDEDIDTDSQEEFSSTKLDPEEAADVDIEITQEGAPSEESSSEFDFDMALIKLQDYISKLAPGSETVLSPSQLFAIIAPGVQYNWGKHSNRLRKVIESASSFVDIRHNKKLGKGAAYSLAVAYVKGQIETVIADTDKNLERGLEGYKNVLTTTTDRDKDPLLVKFDINDFLSNQQALTIAAFLTYFQDILAARGIDKLSEGIFETLSEANPDIRLPKDRQAIIESRKLALRTIGTLLQNQELTLAAIDSIDASDPRRPLFEHLFSIINNDVYSTLAEFAEKEAGVVIAIDHGKYGGVAVLKVSRENDQEPVRLPYVIEDDGPNERSADGDQPLGDGGVDAESIANVASSEQKVSTKKPEKRISNVQKERQEACQRIIGETINQMVANGIDLQSEAIVVNRLAPIFGGQLSKLLRTASERGFIARGNKQHYIDVEDIVMVALGTQSNQQNREYATKNKNALREIIRSTIAKMIEKN
jgi:hypothetical protein